MGIDSRCKLHIKNWNKLPGGWARLIGRVLVPKLTSIISAPLDIEGAKLLDFACYSEDRVAYWFRNVLFRMNIDQPAFSNYDHLSNVTSQTTLPQANQYPVSSQVLQPCTSSSFQPHTSR
ncbi:hypothetical protein Moror_2226 [Moniliophthora roreri MCA 2997]|uniref:Uncharacterized protein n=1 Tax=Moniliophthora roreri (strain MCA 2997) TaxID=1381753 RepID=V2XSB9_MONRO|nr:hypothetical protein Moror_2226 [Moniliophthora roreri MCA 2997]